ncbi:MAG: mycothiol synthase [Ilumatobacteraceae bacterium]|nr:mycothiol synthase [Ilumatobacteraceae bacterium]
MCGDTTQHRSDRRYPDDVLRLEIRRNIDAQGFEVVNGLLEAAERADGQRALSDHLWLDLRQGGRLGFAAIIGWEDDHDHPVAYAQVSRGNDSWSIDLVVHPHHRYDMAAIGPDMLDATLDIVRSEGGGHVHWWVFEPSSIYFELAEKIGLHPGRELYQMRRPLPLEAELASRAEPGFTRGFDFERDATAWLDVNNRAFAKHAEQGDWDIDTLTARTREPWFNAEGFRIAESDGRITGFCWTKMHPDAVGEIYVIAANPDVAGHGLGTRLTVAGLNWLAAHGATTAMLYVDTSNDSAVNMYRKLGFTPAHRERAFVGDIH